MVSAPDLFHIRICCDTPKSESPVISNLSETQFDPPQTAENLDGEQFSREALEQLLKRSLAVRDQILQKEHDFAPRIENVADHRQASARNLLQYVSLRQKDLRSLQQELLRRGLSSLGRCEANVQATLNAVIGVLCRLLL